MGDEQHETYLAPDDQAWHEMRLKGIGASESAAAAGLSEYMSPRELYHLKRGELEPQSDTDAMRRGRALEPLIVQEFEFATQLRVKQYPVDTITHPEHETIFATPDAELEDNEGLECKSTTWRMAHHLGSTGTDEIPNVWLCQAQQQMAVTGWERVHVAVWIDVQTLRTFIVERNDSAIALLIDSDLEMWEKIQAGTPPDEAWDSRSLSLMKKLYKDVQAGDICTLSRELKELWGQQVKLRENAEELIDEADGLKARVLDEIGNAQFAPLDGKYMIRRKIIDKQAYTVYPKPYVDARRVKLTDDVRRLLSSSHPQAQETSK